jgi:RHS repeat-associated protein
VNNPSVHFSARVHPVLRLISIRRSGSAEEIHLINNVADADGHVLARIPTYTATGQPKRIVFGNGVITQHGLDSMEHLSTLVTQGPALPLLGTPAPLQSFSYGYDTRGNLTRIDDAVRPNDQSFEYDARGFLSRAVGPYGEERYEYDAIGNMIRKGALVFHANPSHKMQTDCTIDLSLGNKLINGLAWDDTLLNCAKDLNGTTSMLSADAKAQLTRLIARTSIFSPDIGNSFKMGYDANGSLLGKKAQRYEYDGLNRLIRVRDPLGLVLEENQYAESGERVSQSANGKLTVFIDGVYERMATSLASDVVTRHVPVNGRVLASVQSTRIASPLIQRADDSDLTTCHSRAGIIRFGLQDAERQVRDWLGPGDGAPPLVMTAERAQRIRGAVTATAGAATLLLVLLIGLAVAFRRPIAGAWARGAHICRAFVVEARRSARFARRRPLRSVSATVAAITQLMLAGCGGTDGLERSAGAEIQQSQAKLIDITSTAYYHYDHLGNVHVISDEFGTERQRFETKPYGERFDEYRWPLSDSLRTSFNGQSFEPVSGLYHFGARLYDAEVGRFLSADPTIPHERRTVALNRYAFNANNPVRFIDTNGYSFWDGLKKALVWIGVGIVTVLSIVLTIVTFGAAGAPMALLLGAVIGAAIGFAVGAIWTAAAGKFEWKVALMFAAAGALAGMSVGGLAVSAGSLATATISLQTSVALMNLGGVVGSVGGAIAGATAVARNGCESVALTMIVGWAAGSVVGLINGLGGMAVNAAGGVGFALSTAAGALGFNSASAFADHVKGVVFGDRRIEEMAGNKPEVAPRIPKPAQPDPSTQSAPPGQTISWSQLFCWIQQQLGISPLPLYGFSSTCQTQ